MEAGTGIIDRLRELLGEQSLLTGSDQMARYSRDWSGDVTGRPFAVAKPGSVDQLARLIGFCAEAGVPVVPQGGHTGLVGGASPSPEGNELIVSLERLDRIRSVDPLNFSMVAEAGCVLATLQHAAEEHDLQFPLASEHKEVARSAAMSPRMPAG